MGSDSDSDNESPEVISSSSMKSEREKEFQEISIQKEKLRTELKLKRKFKAEILLIQKQEKQAKLQMKQLLGLDEEEREANFGNKDVPIPTESIGKSVELDPAVIQIEAGGKSANQRVHRKMYPKFNVVVEPLTKLRNPRAAAALSFKEKRLAKVPRENVASALISYREKLQAKNT